MESGRTISPAMSVSILAFVVAVGGSAIAGQSKQPKLTVVTRKAYGGAYDVMNSKHMRADFNFAWPQAEVAVMGPEGAVNIIYRRDIRSSPTPDQRRERLMDDYKARFANPYSAAERGYIDDVIVPHETRPKLIRALETLQTKRVERPKRKHGNIPL